MDKCSTAWLRPGKSCESSSSRKFGPLQCPQNSVIRDKGWMEICVSNVGVAWSNPQIFSANPQSIAFHPKFWSIHPPFSILLPQISFIQPKFSIFNSSFSILSKKFGVFGSRSPQNSVISGKCPQAPLAAFSRSGMTTLPNCPFGFGIFEAMIALKCKFLGFCLVLMIAPTL